MSANESTSLPNKSSNTHGMVVYRSGLPAIEERGALVPWPAQEAAAAAAGGYSAYLHAFRRVWLPATLAGVFLAAIAAFVVWLTQSPTYTALSIIHIEPREQRLADWNQRGARQEDYEAYKGTQQEIIRSRFVLTAALRRPNDPNEPAVADLPMIRDNRDDPVAFLQRKLSVSLPRNTEVMLVSLKGEDKRAVVGLVKAVVDAYIREVVDADQRRRSERWNELDRICAERNAAIEKEQNEIKAMAERLGSVEPLALTTKQQMLLQNLGEARRQLLLLQWEIAKIDGETAAQMAFVNAVDAQTDEEEQEDAAWVLQVAREYGLIDGADEEHAPPEEAHRNKRLVSQAELMAALRGDPLYQQLLQDMAQISRERALTYAVAPGSPLADKYGRRTDELQRTLQAQISARHEEVSREMQLGAYDRAALEIARLEKQREVLLQQGKALAEQVDGLTKEADQVGNSSIQALMKRDELKQLQEIRDILTKEREQLKVELGAHRATPRISVLQQADAPEMPSQIVRLSLTGFAALLGFLLPVGIIVWRDAAAQRINSSGDVPREIGLDVFGVVPLVPTRAARQIASPDHRPSGWRALVCESVDGIAARLLHVAEFERTQVVMVSSAVGGEGKTVLATQLAMSLARTGHRTVLVDFDLRRPAIEKVFKLGLRPGVCEVLRSEAALSEAVQETATPNLSAMTAGGWSAKLIKVLAGGLQDSLFAALRKQFDFVVVDACPILPVADARFVSQHVDAVILAVLRDVSRAPKIRTACRILAGLGVRILGAVVAESAAGVDYHYSRYHARHDPAATPASEG